MKNIKLSIIYYSATGANHQLSQWALAYAQELGAEVRLKKVKELAPAEAIAQNEAWRAHAEAAKDVPEASPDDLEWADAILFSCPTRYGNVPAQMKQFLDGTGGLWQKGKLINKVVSAMTSAGNPHGGQEATILALYITMLHWGALIVAPGYTDPVLFTTGGNPYGTSATAGEDGSIKDDVRKAVEHQVKRMLEVAEKIKG